jgi:xanthine dehydrogenase FAD-binding subunit
MSYKSYHTAGSVNEALEMLAKTRNAQVIAGGTDVMVRLQADHRHLKSLVDISAVQSLKNIELERGVLRIGAAVTYNEIIHSAVVQQAAPMLIEASRVTGAAQIQHMGTLGGNIANASPAGDVLCVLYACEAQIVLTSLAGERIIRVDQLIQSAGKTQLQPGEIITQIQIKALAESSASAFIKYGLRQSQAISVLNVSVILETGQGQIGRAVIALGAVAPTVIFSRKAAQVLTGSILSAELLERAGEMAQQDAHPIDDIRGSADMRRYLVKPLVREALQTAWDRAVGCHGGRI